MEDEDKPYGIKFFIDKDQDVSWLYKDYAPDLTLEQADVIGRIKGMNSIAMAIDRLASTIQMLVDKLPPQA